jgi:hypothetical protein
MQSPPNRAQDARGVQASLYSYAVSLWLDRSSNAIISGPYSTTGSILLSALDLMYIYARTSQIAKDTQLLRCNHHRSAIDLPPIINQMN